MGKDKSWSSKKIWNIRGPEKLRFYCQMCEKQCRDAEGFKSHCSTAGHVQMMKLFLENEEYFTEKFSKEFQEEFLECLKRKFKDKVVLASEVYDVLVNESRNHVHLNSTKWITLEEFIIHLGKTSVCKVDQSQKGFVIKLVVIDETEVKSIEVKQQVEMKYEEKKWRELEKQIEAAKKLEKQDDPVGSYEESTEPIKIVMNTKDVKQENFVNVLDSVGDEKMHHKEKSTSKRKLSNLEMIKEDEEKKREKKNRKDYWLCPDIIVKVTKKGSCCKEKGKVVQVVDYYDAEVELLQDGTKITLNQGDLETVIPNIGGKVLIVNGAYRKEIGVLEQVDFDNFCANIKSDLTGQTIKNVPYEDFSKYVGK